MKKQNFAILKKAVCTDTRGRLVLGETFKNKQYSVHIGIDGEIRLIPVVVIPEKEAWIFKNRQILKSLYKGLEQSAKKEVKSLGAYGKYADSEVEDCA